VNLIELHAVLEGWLRDMDVTPFPTQWANSEYKPVDGTPYQKVDIILGDPANPEQSGTFFQERGFMQVSLRYPANEGRKAIMERAQLIRNRFRFGLPLAANGFSVVIDRTPTISQGANDGNRYQVPVKIRFYANSN
jgi:hypothetical protein